MTDNLEAAIESHRDRIMRALETYREGPWKHEPHRVEFKAHGMDCLILRNPLGAWCGYVAVKEGHPLFRMEYDDVQKAHDDLKVHGGLTFSNEYHGAVCHKPEAGAEDKAWWLGFDCSHFMDLTPGLNHSAGMVYRDQAWVMEETEKLARQLAAID